ASHLARSRERERRRKPRASPKGTAAHAAKRLRDQKSPRWSAGGAPPSLRGQAPLMVPRVPASWHANRVLTRHPGADRRSATPLSGRGNDATRPAAMRGRREKGEKEWRHRERKKRERRVR